MVQSLRATWTSTPAACFEAAALHQAHGGVDDGFGREAMGGAGFEPEDVAGQMECADLAASVGKQLVGANRAADHLIDVFGRLILAVDFLILPVGEFGGDQAGMAGQRAELVGAGAGGTGREALAGDWRRW